MRKKTLEKEISTFQSETESVQGKKRGPANPAEWVTPTLWKLVQDALVAE